MTRRPITAVEREAWSLIGREHHTIDARAWWEIQSRLREAFEQPFAPPHTPALDHLNADYGRT